MKSRWFNIITLIGLLIGMISPVTVQAAPPVNTPVIPEQQDNPTIEVEPELLAQLGANESIGYLIYFKDKADLSAADTMSWEERGRYVVNTLQKVADRSQAQVRAYLDMQGIKYEAFWIDNIVAVESSNRAVFNGLMSYPEIAALRSRRTMGIIEPDASKEIQSPQAIEPNIAHVLADQVWAMGYRGEGMVVANIDTGVRYTHEALSRQYRGTTTGSHDYNWLGAANGDPIPTDDHGHGTHTMGTMVGEDASLTNQIGMAPGAQWIACDGCTASSGCPDTALLTCAQWVVAPYPVGDPGSPDPDKRPNVVNNSWGDCSTSYDSWYQGSVDAWHAAGIYPIFSNGNASNCGYPTPPGLNTVGNPARYGNVTGVGSTGRDNGAYATHSNWGPTDNLDTVNAKPGAEDLKPQVLAPGVNIRSSLNGSDSDYANWGGTSMSAPHVSGLIALMWQAAPCLLGDYATTETIIEDTAVPIPYDDGTGGGAHVPNYATGWGEINAAAAVQMAISSCGDSAITGQVTEQATSNPISGAHIVASTSPTETWSAVTDDLGYYTLNVYSGTYTLVASRYGYQVATVPGVVATTGQTTTQDITMALAPTYEVSGTVTDATTGWPLYAHIDIDGYPDGPIWTDPATGYYSVDLAEGFDYDFDVHAWVAGYEPASRAIRALAGDRTEDFALDAEASCTAPGYAFEGGVFQSFEGAFPPAGWTVVNNGGDCEWAGDDPGSRGNQTGGAGAFAIADSDACGSGTTMNTDLFSPIVDVSDLATVTLEFSYDYNNLSTTEYAAVDVSADGGATWTNVVTWNTDQRGPARFSADVTGLLGGSTEAQVRFRYDAPGWYWWWEVDDFMLGYPVCVPPADGGLVVGNVYDANIGDALTGAGVANDSGGMATTVATADPAVDDAFYTLFSPSGLHTFTASNDGFADDVADVTVVNGDTVVQDFALGAGYIEVTPGGVEVTIQAGDNSKEWLSLENIGVADAMFTLIEVPGGYLPLSPTSAMGIPAPNAERRIELVASGKDDAVAAAEPWAPSGPVELILDDGSAEDAIGLTAGGQFLWLNRFTPDAADYPFTLDQVWMLFRDSADVGEAIELAIWEDTDGDGDPGTGANLLSVEYVDVQANDNATWSVYNLSSPVFFSGPGDVLIGAINRDATGTHPAAIDTTASQVRSWVGIYSGDPPDPPTLPPDAGWGTIDSMGFAGNWMIRGSGVTGTGGGDAIPWLSETPISGTVAAGGTQNVMLTFDAGMSGSNQPGTYHGALQVKTDTPYPDATVPVTMNVLPPASWGKIAGTVSSLGYCDMESNPLEGAEVTIESNTGAMWTLTTGADGTYAQWLDAMYGPVTVTATFDEHESTVVTDVIVTSGVTTTVDLDLRWMAPCVTADPIPLEQTVELGYSTTVPFTVTNWGAGGTSFDLVEKNGGFATMVPVQTYAPLRVPYWDATETAPEGQAWAPMSWGTGSAIPTGARYRGAGTSCDGQSYYIFGGQSGTGVLLDEAWRYDPATDTWTALADMPVALMNFEAACIGDAIYLVGGYDTAAHTNNFQIYDVVADSWTATTWPNARTPMLAVWDEKLYAFGGNPGPSGETWMYDPGTSTWSGPLASMPTANSYGAALTVGDYIYQIGGGLSDTVQRYDPAGDTWDSSGPQLQDARMSALTVWYGDMIYVVSGGGSGGDYWTGWSTTEVYDPSLWPAGSWAYDDESVLTPAVGIAGDCAGDMIWGAGGTSASTYYDTNRYLDDGLTCNFGGQTGGAIPWLAEDPGSGVAAADSDVAVAVTFDASAAITQVTQPGEYFGTLYVSTDDPENGNIAVPVTMTVTPPATWGKLTGAVTGLGYCDADPAPVADVEVLVEASDGMTWTLTTDEMGMYTVWMDQTSSPVTVTVSVPDHEKGEATGVVVAAGVTTTQDFDLRWLVPCVMPDPDALSVTLDMGDTATMTLSVDNGGAVSADWELSEAERDPGFVPSAPSAGRHILVVSEDSVADVAVETALTALGDTYDEVTSSTFYGMDVATILATYDAVVYVGSPSSGSEQDQCMAYLDAGGSLLVADNDFAYFYCDDVNTFCTTYLQASYVSDAGSQGVLTGMDIMAGVNPDISADPWPDDFTISGADAVGIFTAPSANLAGLRIARAGYQAIYLAWDYDSIAGAADQTTVLSTALDWLVAAEPVDIVPWLGEDPTSGTVAADSFDAVTVTFDASVPEVTQPGDYLAWINVDAPDDPVNGGFAVPVTMTVNPPATWAKLDGTVYGLGYCDGEMNPVDGAEVVIENGETVTLTTGADGVYSYWLTPGTYTVTATAADHTVAEAVVTISAGVSQTQDLNLRWLAPCTDVSPDSIADTLPMGASSDHMLTIDNMGAGDGNFGFLEYYQGYVVPPTVLASAPAGSVKLNATGDMALTVNPKATLGVTSVPAPATVRPDGIYALTHSVSQVIMDGNSVSCNASGLVAENSFLRVFDLPTFGVNEYFDVQSVEVGIEQAVSGSGSTQPGTINLYTLDGALEWANMTLIGSADFDIADADSLSVVSVPVTGTAPAGSVLVVEFYIPNGQSDGHQFWPGSNTLGQTAPSYLASVDCGLAEPTDVAAIGFPDMMLVMNVIGFTPEAVDLPWLSEDPLTGLVLGDDSSAVTVTLDAAQVPLPGTYFAKLVVETDDPVEPRYDVAVAMTVTLPATYGKIEGTVYGTGYCDGEMDPLAGANVVIEGSDGVTVAVTTDLSGMYEAWRDEATGPYTVTAMADDHWDGVATGVIVTGTETTVQDLSLRSMAPCVGVEPAELTAEVTLGMSLTTYMTVANTGGYDLNWSLAEGEAGFMPMGPAAGPVILLMFEDIDTAGKDAYRNALTAAGVGWTEWDLDSLGFPTAGDLAAYDVLIWADESTLTPGDADCQVVADWLVSGDKSLFATSVDFLWDLENGSVGNGEHNLYLLFNTEYVGDYAGTGITALEGVPGNPVGDGLTLALAGTSDSNGDYADETMGAPTGLLYGAGGSGSGYSALTSYEGPNYKTVWMGVNFHNGLSTQSERDALMANIIDFFGGGGDVPWLDEDPASGVTAMDSTSTVSVTFDASVPEVTQPGEYYTTLTVESDDAMDPEIALPVTMTVLAPETWGKLAGTVTGLGYCDVNPMSLEDAVVFIESGTGMSWTVSTDVSGTYGIWFDEMYSPVTVTISYEAGYEAQEVTGVVVVSGTTTTLDAGLRWYQPCVSTDDAVAITLTMGTTGTYVLDLANGGPISTPYGLFEEDWGFEVAGPLAVADAFGYMAADSDDVFGPVYDFIDISAAGTPYALGDDDFVGPVPIGFDFPFYGDSAIAPNVYSEVFVNSNGFLSFGAGSTDLSNDVLPDLLTPNNIIALMWDDLVGGTAYVYTFSMCPYGGGECTVVQYDGFTHVDGADAGSWQVVLFDTGNILVQFADAGDYAGATSTTGIENEYGTDGITYAANVPALADGLAVCFAYPGNSPDCAPTGVLWLDEDMPFGDILAGDSTSVTLTFDASLPETMQPGDYLAGLTLMSNDPVNGAQVIPVTMTVEVPAGWGKVGGTVIGWNHCDVAAFELEDALVYVESATGEHWATTTDVSGTYGLWLDEAYSPVTVTVSADGYVASTSVVTFSAASAADTLHELRMDAPCFTMDTYAVDLTVTQGHTVTESMLLSNLGAGMLEISDVVVDAGWMTPDMTSGMIYPDGSHTMNVRFDAAGMTLGEHHGELVIMNNDPMMPMMTVPVTMTVILPTVDVDVFATPPDVTHPGDLITYTIVVTNTSNGPVDVALMNTIPMSTTYVDGSVTGGLNFVQPTMGDEYVEWSGELTSMETKTFTFVVTVSDEVTGGTIDDTVVVTTADSVFSDTESVLVAFYQIFLPFVARGYTP